MFSGTRVKILPELKSRFFSSINSLILSMSSSLTAYPSTVSVGTL